jgi:hypothetical protein
MKIVKQSQGRKHLKAVALVIYCSFLISLLSAVGSASNSTDGTWRYFSQSEGILPRSYGASNRIVTGHGLAVSAGTQIRATNASLPAGRVEVQTRLYRVNRTNNTHELISTGPRQPNNNSYAQNVSHWGSPTSITAPASWRGESFNSHGLVWAWSGSTYINHPTHRSPNRMIP